MKNKAFILFVLLWITLVNIAIGQNKVVFSVKEVSFKNQETTLSGIVFIPIQPHKNKMGVVLIHGSGNSDRTNAWAYAFAVELVNKGIYVLLPDKRGCGKSGGDWKTANYETLAKDAVAGLDLMYTQFSLNKTGIMGLSQGGHYAPLAATLSSKVSFVINIVGAAVTQEEQVIHEMTNTSRQAGLKTQHIQEVLELHALMKGYVYDNNWNAYEKRLNEFKTGEWKEFAQGFPANKEAWIWQWVKLNMRFDPIIYWKKVKQPVFVAYGEKDEEDNVPVWQSTYLLYKVFNEIKHTDYEIHVYPDSGHVLYEKDKAELRADMLERLSAWIIEKTN